MDDRWSSRDVLLAWMTHRVEAISRAQHRLAVEKALREEQATRLRLGVAVEEARGALTRRGVLGQRRAW